MLIENRKSEVTKRVYIYKKTKKVIQMVLYKVSLINPLSLRVLSFF